MNTIKKKVKKLLQSEYNPFVRHHHKILRSQIKNKNATLLCSNCTGGLYHDLGLKFQSPTINLTIYQNDFIRFVTNLDHYLECELTFCEFPNCNFPCALLDDISIRFNHYKSEEEAREKWESRCKRINRDNLFIFMTQYERLSDEDISKLGNIKARGIAVLTGREYPNVPYSHCLERYKAKGAVGQIIKENHITGIKEYEYLFDFVKWLNEANGGDYNIEPYIIENRR